MGRLFQVKLKQLKRYETRLDELEADINAVALDIASANNRANRQRLERQETNLIAEMNQVAQQYDALEQELKGFPEYQEDLERKRILQELVILLTDISLDQVMNAYRFCFPHIKPPTGLDQEGIIRRVAEMPDDKNAGKLLGRLVYSLSQDSSLTPPQQQALQEWAEAQGLPTEILDNEQDKMATNKSETCLMVKVKPRNLNEPTKGYLLSAVLFTDSDPLEREVELKGIAIAIPAPSNPNSQGYTHDELKLILGQLIDTCGAEHGIALTDLTIQLFLPVDLMSLPIEHWQLVTGQQCCGQRCKTVIVRSYERHFLPDYRSATGDWKKYWHRFVELPEESCTATLTLLNPVKGKTQIQGNKPKVIGCRFIEHHQPQQQEEFWDSLLNQGLPIAFWMRYLGLTDKEAKQILGSLTRGCAIAKLPASLSRKRQQVLAQKYEQEHEQLQKAPLCLLWDNPYRPFPSITYQS